MANRATGLPPAMNVPCEGGSSHNVSTMEGLSLGHEAGLKLGVASAMAMEPKSNLVPSITVLNGGLPATKLTAVILQN